MIRLSKSVITDAEKNAVLGVLDREYLGMGQEVQQFEELLSEFFGRPAVCVVNGTAALHLACQAVGIGPGDEVLVQSLTYVASFQAISATGAKPISCDIDPKTLTLDWRDAERRITPQTKAVMPVHYSGGVGDLEGIYTFAKRNRLRVIEDAAHAFGSIYNNHPVGGFGDIACFSFDGIKNITSGEGGCIVTNDDELLQYARDARLLGVEEDTEKRYGNQRSWEFDVKKQGWRYHMSNMMAAVGIEQLKRFEKIKSIRQQCAKHYDLCFKNKSVIRPMRHNYDKIVPHIYVVRIKGLKNRKALQRELYKHDIQTGYHYQPNHWLTKYHDPSSRPLPVTDDVFPEIMTLPLHSDLSLEDVRYVCDKLKELISK